MSTSFKCEFCDRNCLSRPGIARHINNCTKALEARIILTDNNVEDIELNDEEFNEQELELDEQEFDEEPNNNNQLQNYSDNFDVNNVNGAGVQQPRILTETYSTKPNFNPFTDVKGQEKINYNNDGLVRWYGAFTQLEYTKGNLSAFVQGAISQQGFKRVDYFKYKSSDPLSSTDFENILGGNVKGGANYNNNEKHNVFLKAG